jgi:hypothetical protein
VTLGKSRHWARLSTAREPALPSYRARCRRRSRRSAGSSGRERGPDVAGVPIERAAAPVIRMLVHRRGWLASRTSRSATAASSAGG